MGKIYTAKTPPGDFQVTTPETPLLSQQAVTSKGIPSTLPTYSWTFTPIPNWTSFVVTVPLSDTRLSSTWLTNYADPSTRLQSPTKKVVGCKVLQFIHTMKIKKMLGYKTLQYTYMLKNSLNTINTVVKTQHAPFHLSLKSIRIVSLIYAAHRFGLTLRTFHQHRNGVVWLCDQMEVNTGGNVS